MVCGALGFFFVWEMEWRHNLSSGISLCFMSPVQMVINYSDKVSGIKAASQKQKSYTISYKICSKQKRVHCILLPLPLGEKQSLVLKSVLAVKMQWKQPRLILGRTVVTLMIRRVYLFCLVLLTLTCSYQALRELRITSALFVCWKGRMQGTETLFSERSTQGHLSEMPDKQTEHCSPSLKNIDFSSPVHFVAISILKHELN